MKKIGLVIICILFFLHAKAQIIITGAMIDAVGADAGYEYIQLMATEDIDFAKSNFSLVVSVNTGKLGTIGADGWATGGVRTFKFNLTQGKASKGTFFYVGGEKKRLVGYWQGIKSTDISEHAADAANRANWIRTIKYAGDPDGTLVGDGFGEKTKGLLLNGSSNPNGIAVFAGTEISGDTEPLDVLFLSTSNPLNNNGILSSYNPALDKGYRITNNDFYSTKKSTYFATEGNRSALLYPNAKGLGLELDRGYFLMLGGVYNSTKKRWEKPRTTNYVLLCKDKQDATTATLSQLADIEKSSSVTKLK